ncbi:MAG: hypothetical protein GX275_14090 [Clostridiales bacterium]|nr:hypothetical protein [Clostridiales bacterium]
MNINLLESLVKKAKNGDKQSKEVILKEFTPLIVNLSKNIHIPGFDYYDINNECYLSLLKAISCYEFKKSNDSKFVFYATSTIKKNLYYLIEKNIKISRPNGEDYLEFNEEIDINQKFSTNNIEDYLKEINNKDFINEIVSSLNDEEKNLFSFLFLENKSISDYAYSNNISYNYGYKKKNKLINKIKNMYSKEYLN